MRLTTPWLFTTKLGWSSKYAWGWKTSSRPPKNIVAKVPTKIGVGFPPPNESFFAENSRNSRISDGSIFLRPETIAMDVSLAIEESSTFQPQWSAKICSGYRGITYKFGVSSMWRRDTERRGDWHDCHFWCFSAKLVALKDGADAHGASIFNQEVPCSCQTVMGNRNEPTAEDSYFW